MSSHPVSLAAPVEVHTDPIKGSRFIGWAGPAADRAACDAAVAERKAAYPDARHHCWAWLGHGPTDIAFSDAGEPNGSAGRPILDVLRGQGLTDSLVVVSRWFGGTKLGVGGLVRAYGAAANAALDAAERIELVPQTHLVIDVAYADLNPVEAALAQRDLTPERAFGDGVRFTLTLASEAVPDLQIALRDATAGRARVHADDLDADSQPHGASP